MLAAFFPGIGTLYTADVWDVPAASAPTLRCLVDCDGAGRALVI